MLAEEETDWTCSGTSHSDTPCSVCREILSCHSAFKRLASRINCTAYLAPHRTEWFKHHSGLTRSCKSQAITVQHIMFETSAQKPSIAQLATQVIRAPKTLTPLLHTTTCLHVTANMRQTCMSFTPLLRTCLTVQSIHVDHHLHLGGQWLHSILLVHTRPAHITPHHAEHP